MELKELVCSLELSKELEKYGIKQDSYFWWYHKRGQRWHVDSLLADRFLEDIITVSAPTFAELLEKLPDKITTTSKTYSKEKDYYILIIKTKKTKWFNVPDYFVGYRTLDNRFLHSERADTGANSCAKMLIYLLKNNLIEK